MKFIETKMCDWHGAPSYGTRDVGYIFFLKKRYCENL